MPTMANITTKKADGTTTVVFSQVQAASGDKSLAIWIADALGSSRITKPVAQMIYAWNQNRSARKGNLTIRFPHSVTNSATGVVTVDGSVLVTVEVVAPASLPDAFIADSVAMAMGFVNDSLTKACFSSGNSPT